MKNNLTTCKNTDNLRFNEVPEIKRVKRKLIEWLWKFAQDEEVYEIVKFYNIKID